MLEVEKFILLAVRVQRAGEASSEGLSPETFGSHIWVESVVRREVPVLAAFLCPDEKQLRKGLFWHIVQGTAHGGGESSSQQELKTAGCTASTVRRKKAMIALIRHTVSFLYSPGPNPRLWCSPLL